MMTRTGVGYVVRAAGLELAWLLGSWGFAWALARYLLGPHLLDIQLHNTFFVLNSTSVAAPIFLLVATQLTAVRAWVYRFRASATNVVLGLLGTTWLLFILAIGVARAHSPHL